MQNSAGCSLVLSRGDTLALGCPGGPVRPQALYFPWLALVRVPKHQLCPHSSPAGGFPTAARLEFGEDTQHELGLSQHWLLLLTGEEAGYALGRFCCLPTINHKGCRNLWGEHVRRETPALPGAQYKCTLLIPQ